MNNLRKRLEQEIGLSDYKVTRTIEIFLSEGWFSKKRTTHLNLFGETDVFSILRENKYEGSSKVKFVKILKMLGCDEFDINEWIVARKEKRKGLSIGAITLIANYSMKHKIPIKEIVHICGKEGWAGFNKNWERTSDDNSSKTRKHEIRKSEVEEGGD